MKFDRDSPGQRLGVKIFSDQAAKAGPIIVRQRGTKKFWYCVATVGGQYFWATLQSFSAFHRWGDTEQRSLARRSWFLLQRIEGLYKTASFGNLLLFLLTGRYRSLIERALHARLVYGTPHINRAVSFKYMNRQLVWNEFSHKVPSTDYLLVRSSKGKLSIRRIDRFNAVDNR